LIAQAVHCAACLPDLDSVTLDGSFSRELLDALLAYSEQAMAGYSWEGVTQPTLLPGTIGSDARLAARCCRCTRTSRPTAICS
jgi:hypothetical protein